MNAASEPRTALCFWSVRWRAVVFALSATSIWCLLVEFFGICTMRTFTLWVFLPATAGLVALAALDRVRGDRRLWRAVMVGGVAGFIAACAYDLFRVPFVYAPELGIDGWLPHLKLFKVFPRFGAMILGQPPEQGSYSAAAHALGWLYHFSNGMTFGVMLLALICDATVRSGWWAVVLAVGLEVGMLVSPYPRYFAIALTGTFVVVTLLAHLVFGVALGWSCRKMARRSPNTPARVAAC